MRERPILFSAPMVRAILDGRKTVTRRLCTMRVCGGRRIVCPAGPEDTDAKWAAGVSGPCPYGATGDRLWVRETWRPSIAHSHGPDACDCADVVIRYAADGEERFFEDRDTPNDWLLPKAARTGNVSPLFLQRWASRILLDVVSVRVERLHDITEEDARAEGVEPRVMHGSNAHRWIASREGFSDLWDSINGERAPWASNPWVWRVEFRRVMP